MLRLRDCSTRQLENMYEDADGDLELLQALTAELAQRPSQQAQALLAEIQVAAYRLEQGNSSERIDWDEVITQKIQQDAARDSNPDSEQNSAAQQHSPQQQASHLLNTWMICETLTPQTFKAPEDLAQRGQFTPISDTLPWLQPQPALEPGKSVFYQIYLGDLNIKNAHEDLIARYGAQPEERGQTGFVPLAVATFNSLGILVGEYGVGVSCFGWSFGRARLEKIHHLPFWQGAERLLIRRLRKQLTPLDEAQQPRPLAHEDLAKALDWLIENLDLPAADVAPVRFAVRIVQSDKRHPPGSPLLNSFLLADLWRAQHELEKDRASPALKAYLGMQTTQTIQTAQEIQPPQPTAQLHLQSVIHGMLVPSKLPLVRWPSAEGFALDALQQTAVNIALDHTTPALFSVHGPPGTGKTTLLRDIIAGAMYQRAAVLCEFDDPEDAFERQVPLKFGDQRFDIYQLNSQLLGHEILVCSRNNKAVENISLELPMKRAVSNACGQADFFSATMNAYLDEKNAANTPVENNRQPSLFEARSDASFNDEFAPDKDPWGLIAVALGNGKNRQAYVRGVWLDDLHGLRLYFDVMRRSWAGDEAAETELNHSPEYLFLPASKAEALQHWLEAKSLFLATRQKVLDLIARCDLAGVDTHSSYAMPELPILQSERDALFVAMIQLQKAFILAVAPKLEPNLQAYFRVVAGARGSRPEMLPHLWASGALITPVISTTFASVHAMFHDMPAASLGWVLIDEAGQAAPQDAVGALFRARRALVVGDPQQIEPVVTMPAGLIQGIANYHQIEPLTWTAPDVSVQSLADRVNSFGLPTPENSSQQALGWPILMHRRCSAPMFSMINHLAYDGLMIQAKAPEQAQGCAQWLHVAGESQQKWCPQEGDMALALTLRLLQETDGDVYIISPFRHCATSLRKLFRSHKKELQSAGVRQVNDWVRQSIGTVHTFQGRQAPHVILVLGAPSPQEQGAREWATRKVNLLNVAVSRAQTSLSIIGNRGLWGHLGAMHILSRFL